MQYLIPFAAVTQSVPVMLKVVPQLWVVPIVGISLQISLAPLIPLQPLICKSVPAERLGEANGIMGSAKSLSSLLAYILTALVSQVLIAQGKNDCQFVFFLAASLISLVMLVFLYNLKCS